jgi:predicted amino acid racemase
MRSKIHLENTEESHRTTQKTRKLSEIDISIMIKCVQKEMEKNLECFCSGEELK